MSVVTGSGCVVRRIVFGWKSLSALEERDLSLWVLSFRVGLLLMDIGWFVLIGRQIVLAFDVFWSPIGFAEAECLKLPLDISNDHLIFMFLFLKSLYFYFQFFKQIIGIDIVILFKYSILIF